MSPTDVRPLILASGSPARRALLAAAGVAVEVAVPRLDEAAAIAAMAAEGLSAREIAEALAEAKARRIAARRPGAVVIGADQTLSLDGRVIDKARDADAVRAQLLALRGRRHALHSAVVLLDDGDSVWRHVGEARLTMRAFGEAYLDRYLARHGADLVGTAGGYRVEGEGMRLFARIDGEHTTILGLPMLPLLGYLVQRGWIAG